MPLHQPVSCFNRWSLQQHSGGQPHAIRDPRVSTCRKKECDCLVIIHNQGIKQRCPAALPSHEIWICPPITQQQLYHVFAALPHCKLQRRVVFIESIRVDVVSVDEQFNHLWLVFGHRLVQSFLLFGTAPQPMSFGRRLITVLHNGSLGNEGSHDVHVSMSCCFPQGSLTSTTMLDIRVDLRGFQ